MKYEFKFVSTDNYELNYTNKDDEKKTIAFKRSVNIAKELESVYAKARIKMFKELTNAGLTKQDLIVKKENNGVITYDESNYIQLETSYTNIERALVIDNVFKSIMGMTITEFLIEIGINPNSTDPADIKQIELFTQKFLTILSGEEEQTPSNANKE